MGVENGSGDNERRVIPFPRFERVVKIAHDTERLVTEVISALNGRLGELRTPNGGTDEERAESKTLIAIRASLEEALEDMQFAWALSEKNRENPDHLQTFEIRLDNLKKVIDEARPILGMGP